MCKIYFSYIFEVYVLKYFMFFLGLYFRYRQWVYQFSEMLYFLIEVSLGGVGGRVWAILVLVDEGGFYSRCEQKLSFEE